MRSLLKTLGGLVLATGVLHACGQGEEKSFTERTGEISQPVGHVANTSEQKSDKSANQERQKIDRDARVKPLIKKRGIERIIEERIERKKSDALDEDLPFKAGFIVKVLGRNYDDMGPPNPYSSHFRDGDILIVNDFYTEEGHSGENISVILGNEKVLSARAVYFPNGSSRETVVIYRNHGEWERKLKDLCERTLDKALAIELDRKIKGIEGKIKEAEERLERTKIFAKEHTIYGKPDMATELTIWSYESALSGYEVSMETLMKLKNSERLRNFGISS